MMRLHGMMRKVMILAMMNKPLLPKNATQEQIYQWESDMVEYENQQIQIQKGLYALKSEKTPKKPTIDENGYRHVFCVMNALGVRRYFDSQRDAITLAREAVNQPCRLIDIPLLPRYEWHSESVETLAPLIDHAMQSNP